MEFTNILNPFNIGPMLFSVNIYSYLFPIKFLLMSIGFVVLLGICLEKFKGKNPYGESLGETSIIFICIAVGIVLLFFYFVMNGATDLERDSMGSEYRSNYVNQQKSERRIEELKNDGYNLDHILIRKEKRKLDQYEKNIRNIPITEDYEENIKKQYDNEKLMSLEDKNSKINLEYFKITDKYAQAKNKNIGSTIVSILDTKAKEKHTEEIEKLKKSIDLNLNEIERIESRNEDLPKRHKALKDIADYNFEGVKDENNNNYPFYITSTISNDWNTYNQTIQTKIASVIADKAQAAANAAAANAAAAAAATAATAAKEKAEKATDSVTKTNEEKKAKIEEKKAKEKELEAEKKELEAEKKELEATELNKQLKQSKNRYELWKIQTNNP